MEESYVDVYMRVVVQLVEHKRTDSLRGGLDINNRALDPARLILPDSVADVSYLTYHRSAL